MNLFNKEKYVILYISNKIKKCKGSNLEIRQKETVQRHLLRIFKVFIFLFT